MPVAEGGANFARAPPYSRLPLSQDHGDWLRGDGLEVESCGVRRGGAVHYGKTWGPSAVRLEKGLCPGGQQVGAGSNSAGHTSNPGSAMGVLCQPTLFPNFSGLELENEYGKTTLE